MSMEKNLGERAIFPGNDLADSRHLVIAERAARFCCFHFGLPVGDFPL